MLRFKAITLIGFLALNGGVIGQCLPPQITTHPADAAACVGDSVTFFVVATGSPMDHLWFHDASSEPLANRESVTIPSVTLADAGEYWVVLTNDCGTTTSLHATLTVNEPPVITVGPGTQSACLGESASFRILVTGGGPYTIEWSTPRSGPGYVLVGTHMTLDNVTAADAGPIHVRVHNACNAMAEAHGWLDVIRGPTIVQQPMDALVCEGGTTQFSVSATGASLGYQWMLQNAPIKGAVGPTLSIADATLADAGSYSVEVANPCGSTRSAPASLTVVGPPVIDVPPGDQTIGLGLPVVLSVIASTPCAGPDCPVVMTYTWYHDGVMVPGADPVLDLGPATIDLAGTYTVLAMNRCGKTSASATITIVEPPTIVIPPEGGAICPGGSLTLSVTAAGTPPLDYQWYKDGVPLPGETASQYLITSASSADEGSYSVLVHNDGGRVVWPWAAIVVIAPSVRSWAPVSGGMDGAVLALQSFDDGSGSALYAGGMFTLAGGVPASRIARWINDAWQEVGGGMNGDVHALGVFDLGTGPALYAAGAFTMAGASPVNRIARWDGSAWLPLGAGIQNGIVRTLEVFDDGFGLRLYAGGSFSIGGLEAGLASWDGTTWTTVGGGVAGTVEALEVFDDGSGPRLFVGGSFPAGGAIPDARLVRYGADGWSSIGGPAPTNTVRALCRYDDGTGAALYVGGEFQGFNGLNGIGRWSGSAWSALGQGLSPGGVFALAQYDDGDGLALYAGGSFTASGSLFVSRTARWRDGAWSELGMGRDDLVRALAIHATNGCLDLYAGGWFMSSGGVATPYIARWKAGFTLDLAQPIGPGSLTVTNGFGPAAASYFTAFSADPANATSPGGGSWYGLHITMQELLDEFLLGAPPFVGVLDSQGISFYWAPPETLAAVTGMTFWGVTVTYDPILLVPAEITSIEAITVQ